MRTHSSSKLGVFVSFVIAASAIVACGAPSASDSAELTASAVDTSASVDATARAYATASTKLANATRVLAAGGWTIGARTYDRVQESDAVAIGETGAWTRVRVDVTSASDATSHGTLILAWRDGAEDVLAFTATDDEAREAMRDAVSQTTAAGASDALAETSDAPALEASSEEGASGVASEAAAAACKGYQGVCTANSQCCKGLACNLPFIGPVTKPTHRCGCASPKNYEYTEKIGTSVACFNLPDNPLGAAFWTRHKRGCGDALCRTAKGCGVACPSIVMSTSLGIECGQYNGRC